MLKYNNNYTFNKLIQIINQIKNKNKIYYVKHKYNINNYKFQNFE